MSIRKAELNDFEAIDSFDIFAGERRKDIERGECFVAVENEQVVGYIVFNHSFFLMPFIQFLCVDQKFRQKGFAGKLLDYVEQTCEGEKLFTSTESDNLTMVKVFGKRGYRISGVIENIQEKSEIVFCKKMLEVVKDA
ncbi:MAG: GNAT family N-acetyltransferase [Pyrinomonadaceae bacterium]